MCRVFWFLCVPPPLSRVERLKKDKTLFSLSLSLLLTTSLLPFEAACAAISSIGIPAALLAKPLWAENLGCCCCCNRRAFDPASSSPPTESGGGGNCSCSLPPFPLGHGGDCGTTSASTRKSACTFVPRKAT